MKSVTNFQRISNSLSKIRGGKGALILLMMGVCHSSTNVPALTGTPS